MDVGFTDADLVVRIGDGDREAEAELCRRMWPRIRLYGLRHLRTAPEADDLAQQVLVAVIEALRAGRLRDPAKLAHFALSVGRNTVIELRRTTRRRERLLEEFGPHLLPPPAAPAPFVDLGQLARCVQGLKERERSVVLLTFYDDRSSADAASLVGVSEANLRVIRHRAIRQLRVCMGAAG